MIISIVTPVFNPPLKAWKKAAKSVLAQSDPNWQWIIVDDKSTNKKLQNELLKLSKLDARVKVIFSSVNKGIVGASNVGIESATGEFVGFLDHDDSLDRRAIEFVRQVLISDNSVDIVYTDEDKIDKWGRHYHQTQKPIWSPEKLRGQMYMGHFSVYRRELILEAGLLRSQCEGSQDHDLALRVSEKARKIVRIPKVLYHWRVVPGSTAANAENKPYTWTAGLVAVRDHLSRTGLQATADFGDHPSHYKINRTPSDIPNVSVVIPTRGSKGIVGSSKATYVVELVKSLSKNSQFRNIEYVIVYDSETPKRILTELSDLDIPQLQFVEFHGVFNFSRKCNQGALHSSGDILIFLNDDMQPITQNVIGQLAAPLIEESVGIVGAKLRFEDGSIQHGGHIHDLEDNRINYYGAPGDYPGEFGALIVNREVSGVTGACMAMRKSTFFEVGGFSEIFPNSYNDVDISNKTRSLGYRILWLANVEMTHFESKSRIPTVSPGDYFAINTRWGKTNDEYFA